MLYGAAYYHEYQPYERLAEDIQLMQQAGLTVVRLANPPGPVGNRRMACLSSRGWIASLMPCTRRKSRLS